MRRRYRTATQLAIARGDPLPVHLRDDYWGLTGLPRFTNGGGNESPAGITGDRGGKKGRWDRIPKLEEAELAGKAAERNDELFYDITVSSTCPPCPVVHIADGFQPVTLHSLLTPDPRSSTTTTQSNDPNEPITAASSSRARRFNMQAFRRTSGAHTPTPDGPEPTRSKPAKKKEIDREIQEGEDMRLAVVIQMPVRGEGTRKRQSWNSDDEEEEVGWETGMELGVWEGNVGR